MERTLQTSVAATTAIKEYNRLITTISRYHETGQTEAIAGANLPVLNANWNIGRELTKLTGNERAPYGQNILDSLSENLNDKYGKGFSVRNLRYMRMFHQSYERNQLQPTFRWSHYQILLSLPRDERAQLEQRILNEKLSPQKLKSLLKNTKEANAALPRPTGKLNVYRLKQTAFMNSAAALPNLDLGFGIYANEFLKDLPDMNGDGSFRVSRQEHGFTARPTSNKDLYLYRAIPERIVDGDTLIVHAQTVFNIQIRIRVRLRGVEVPEKGSPENEHICKFIEKRLNNCRFLLLKAHGQDRYGRWLGDVLYQPYTVSERKVLETGNFLNLEIIRELNRITV